MESLGLQIKSKQLYQRSTGCQNVVGTILDLVICFDDFPHLCPVGLGHQDLGHLNERWVIVMSFQTRSAMI
jgi:hypothetical protein